ncbi:MAG TPA: TonB-dependent receptor plug domain-containing protein, partial [Chitinophagaceae bacterium]|nr:TonB-dependent receptor plug domain-containing protein [Chitinophagaceae bacterium]
TITDQFGYFSFTLPKGRHTLNIQSRGKKDAIRHIILYSDGKMDIYLHDQIIALKEVVVSSKKTSNVRSVQLGVDKLNISTIKQVPTVFGEADILRVILNLPGVKSVGEAGTGFNVRGGSTDQNLILFSGATIYNPSHFFGFFSAFNPDVVKDVELYKSSIPAKYGGRLSSVLDITSREGNKKNFAGSAGIGPVTSRLNVEGPFSKRDSSSSFVIGARATYADWLLNLLPHQYDKSQASFYDVSLHTTHDLNKKNSLYLTAYISKDHFNLNNDTAYEFGNRNVNVQWKHTFNNKLSNLTGVGYDFYQYDINSDANKINAYNLKFNVSQASLKSDFNYYLNPRHTIEFGLSSIYYKLHPGSYTPVGSESLVKSDIVPAEQGLESAVYLGDRFNVSPAFSVNYAIRYSMYQYLGPQSVSTYAPGVPRDESSRTETKEYGKGDIINTYHGPEYRLALRYAFSPDFSIKAGINSLRQYIHMLSNTAAIAPTDIWKLSDPNIKPQEGEQVSLGFYKNFKSNTIETSVEVYYKRMRHYLDYKSGATLVLNHNIETDVINTRGKAYGIELLIKKIAGKLNGWIGYSYSRTFLKMDDPIAGEVINNGEYYPSNYDKPHDLSIVGNIRLSHRFSVSSNIVYSTGRPITLPFGMYYYAGAQRVLYSNRNEYRIPDNFRIDLSMNIEGNARVHQRTHNSWTIGVYNLTGRKNPYSVYFISENGVIKGYKLSIFGSIIPFVNFNIRF